MVDELPKKQRKRSPNYPGLSLQEAIERSRQLHEKEGRHAANIEILLSHWGYASKSGAGMVTLAALLKYGLLEDEGSGKTRKARLSDDAWTVLNDPSSKETLGIIQRLALLPPIYSDVWKRYGASLPSDATLKRDLVLDMGFNEGAAAEFIKNFRRTIAFAQLDSKVKPHEVMGNDELRIDSTEIPRTQDREIGENQRITQTGVDVGMVEIPLVIPVENGKWPRLIVPSRMSESQFRAMLTMIEAIKAGLVEPANEQPKPAVTDGVETPGELN